MNYDLEPTLSGASRILQTCSKCGLNWTKSPSDSMPRCPSRNANGECGGALVTTVIC